MSILPPPLIFPDIEAMLRTYLEDVLDVPVSTQVPNPRPSEFVRIRRTGGSRVRRTTDQSMLTVECWSTSSVDASNLARLVRAHVNATPGRVPEVKRAQEFSGPAYLPDPDSQQARYTWTVSLDVHGSDL